MNNFDFKKYMNRLNKNNFSQFFSNEPNCNLYHKDPMFVCVIIIQQKGHIIAKFLSAQ